jgi:uncharacterized protein YbjT (DUF2867 family)
VASTQRSVVLVGATGLVGGECLSLLLADPAFERVTVLARRPLDGSSSWPKLTVHVADFEHLAAHADLLAVDALICALGTTIGQAGSKERFRAVDYGIPLALARLGAERGLKHFLLVSALGADPHSRVFYNRVKGELEQAIAALPLPRLTIVRPSLLLGERREFRLGESIAKRFAFLMPGKYAAIHARDVAAALVRFAKDDAPGRRIVESSEMRP